MYQSGFRRDLFSGKVIFVAGGGGGLGRCIAHELASLGADRVLAGRTQEKLDKTAEEIIQPTRRDEILIDPCKPWRLSVVGH